MARRQTRRLKEGQTAHKQKGWPECPQGDRTVDRQEGRKSSRQRGRPDREAKQIYKELRQQTEGRKEEWQTNNGQGQQRQTGDRTGRRVRQMAWQSE
jgi:hypothetical protein